MIGVFDSGIGGLTYLNALLKIFPNVDICYLGDTKNAPYGDREPEEIIDFAEKSMKFFEDQQCPLVIIACNTVCSDALRHLQIKYNNKMKILGVLIPTTEIALELSLNRKIGILGTTQTVESKKYEKEFEKRDVNVQTHSLAAPELVPLIESGRYDSKEMKEILKRYVSTLLEYKIDTFILGCTHYKIIKKSIAKIVPDFVKIVNSSRAAATKLPSYLEHHQDISEQLTYNKNINIYSTGDKNAFKKHIELLFPHFLEDHNAVVREVELRS